MGTGSETCLKIDVVFEIWDVKEKSFSPAVLHLHICQNAHGLTWRIPSYIPPSYKNENHVPELIKKLPSKHSGS